MMSKLSKEEIRKRLSRKHLCPVCGKTEFPKYLGLRVWPESEQQGNVGGPPQHIDKRRRANYH